MFHKSDWHICLQQESCHCHFYGKKIVYCPFEVQTRHSINVPIKIINRKKKRKKKELLSPLKGKKTLLSKEKERK